MKINSIISLAGALALIVFAGHAIEGFAHATTNTANTATNQSVDSISGGFDAAFQVASNG